MCLHLIRGKETKLSMINAWGLLGMNASLLEVTSACGIHTQAITRSHEEGAGLHEKNLLH